jgi:hypothetical protein
MNEKEYLELKVRQSFNEIDDGFHEKFHWVTKLDSSNCWRIYVSWNVKDDIIMPFDTQDYIDGQDCMSNDSSFGFDDFSLPLWDYGSYEGRHEIGLDKFPYSALTDENTKWKKDDPIVTHERINELAIQIINCIIEYQSKKENILQFNKEMDDLETQKNKIREKWEGI